ncbi:hypothetical protein [Lysinibacillus odysseyi]|uniref:Uncharacterized protein n=1 Tax=Lysinibacillus odysseyi 34hs-1 = NBRC 100172 TaxID=1220589 RepID=A0A0A3IY90_9BACI|nr:hypothetical protein [Lysinibacillus odysseyi]KGR88415.1 hypothetical protein CD32_01775 [Lysinibacillus odysseyi 34hs-1 = NBRC 100172]
MDQQTIDRVAEVAARHAVAAYEEQKGKVYEKERSKRLHNAKLLLKHYREFKSYVDKIDNRAKASVPKIAIRENENIINLIEFGEDIVSSIKETSQRTIAMVQYIDRALATLEYIYQDENNTRYYNILKKRYMDGLTIEQIAELYRMNNRSIYKVLDSVTERLAVLLFGVYGIKIE